MAEAAEAAAPPEPVVLKAGQVIQGYEIQSALGKGKFSIVYMAKRLADESMCALKRINIFDMMNPKQREKCMKEVRLLQSMDHPNIVKLLDTIVDRHDLLIIVEWAEKGDLKRLIRKKSSNGTSFSEPTIWEYTRQLAAALHHMHSQRIMHRDLKPANVFVTMAGTLKLGDLGLGRFFSSQTLEAFSKVGTPLYMSPEVLHGAGYDMRSDVWSLGCVVYELAMLRSPFKSDQQLSLYDLFVRISKGDYPPLAERCSSSLKTLVSQMLHLESAKRFDVVKVLEVCNARVKQLQAAEPECRPPMQTEQRSRPSPLLVMDDIVEKLKLLNCEELLLLPSGMPLLHRCFFTQQLFSDGDLTQFTVMHKLMHWLLDMIRQRNTPAAPPSAHRRLVKVDAADASAGPRREEVANVRQRPSIPSRGTGDSGAGIRPGDAAAGGGSTAGGAIRRGNRGGSRRRHEDRRSAPSENHEDLATNLMSELKAHGIPVAEDTHLQQLQRGWGEDVCLIINELINQELVGRDFHFERPAWRNDNTEYEQIDEEEELMEAGCRWEESAPASEISSEPDSESSCEREVLVPVPGFECSAAPLLEPVHEAPHDVSQAAWLQELERVKPLLCRQTADTHQRGWRWSFNKARQLSSEVQTILHGQDANGRKPARRSQLDGTLLCSSTSSREPRPHRLIQTLQACRARWSDELSRISDSEERLQNGPAGTELASLREAIAKETQRSSVLRGSVAALSEDLSNAIHDLESVRSSADKCDGLIQDPKRKLSKLRAALRRLQIEDRQLALRVGLLQCDLTNTLASGKRGS